MSKSIIYIKKLTAAEAGGSELTNTHETYIRLPNYFDYEEFFQDEYNVEGSGPITIDFKAINLTKGHTKEEVSLSLKAYRSETNQEKRIPGITTLFRENNVKDGDFVRLESRISDGETKHFITFFNSEDFAFSGSATQIYYRVTEDDTSLSNLAKRHFISKGLKNKSIQQIYYGAPGTGKSHATDKVAAKYADTVRTTFHPDSDYSTFVGSYKPAMKAENRYGLNGSNTIGMVYPNGANKDKPIVDNKIEYKFIKQAFLKAYIRAWKKFLSPNENYEVAPQFLVIEEINRGNCAQIFGDLFQLLDRKKGFSEYPIEADEDIRKALIEDDGESFGSKGLQFTPEQEASINALYDQVDDNGNVISLNVADKIARGELLVLPCNLYIWATMNTSDQSLFPIDSAFKRRWDWKYMRIKDAGKQWRIAVSYKNKEGEENMALDWWEFVKKINEQIFHTVKSEDKQLGYFFCKATQKAKEEDSEPTIITPETFVGKVIFYLWQDVFKATGFRNSIFKDADGNTLKFHDFYDAEVTDDNPEGINMERLRTFVTNVMNAETK